MAERRHRFRTQTGAAVYWRPTLTSEDWQEAVLMDISSGGALLRSLRAPVHHDLIVVLPLDDGQPSLVVTSTLVRIDAQLESGEFAWALSFVGLDHATQARLTRFVFSEARRQQIA